MSANSEGQKEDRTGGGGAVNDLTPPGEQTMKYIPNEQKTIQQPPPGSVQQNTVMQPQGTIPQVGSLGGAPGSRAPSSLSGKGKTSMAGDFGHDVALAVEIQDLTGERLLMAAPRVEAHGQMCPALNAIPLIAKIGQGGMGAVYYGIHPRLRSEVAVKVLPFHLAEQDPGMIRRFFREAQIAAQVRSPHLCNVMDVNEEAGLFFLVMEFVTGCTAGQYLKALIEKGQQGMPEKDALDVTIAATEGLWAAHAQGVVHRDIKPDNIMIPYMQKGSKEYDLKRGKLMDLGLARSEEGNQSLTGAQSAMGTPGYMAPEQAMDAKTADKRSDVFSMGATIYCLLTGKPPFKGETIMKVLMATMHEPHEPVIKHRPDVSPMLNEILEKTLCKKQDQRFADAKQLLTALEDCRRLLSGEGGAGAFSGNRTFVAGSAASAGTVAQQTVMHAGPASGKQAAPAKGNKGMLYVAAGVAVVLLGGGAAVMLKGGARNTARIDPNPSPVPAPARVIDETTKLLLKKHTKFMNEAIGSLEKGDIEDAKLSFDLAKSFSLSDISEAKALETKFESMMKALGRKKDFDAGMKEVEVLVAKKQLKAAVTLINKLDPPDDASKKLYETKEKSLTELWRGEEKSAKALTQLDEIAAYGSDKLDLGLEKLADIKKTFPKPEDEVNVRAVALAEKLERLRKDRDTKASFNRYMEEGKAAEAKKDYDGAFTSYLEAKKLMPVNPDLRAALDRLQPLLDANAKQAAAERLGRELAEIMGKANEQFKAQQFDQVVETLGSALAIRKDDTDALALLKRAEEALGEKKRKEEAQRKRNDFLARVAAARALFDAGDLPSVQQKIAEFDAAFKDDPALMALKTALAKKSEELKAKAEYASQLDLLRDSLRNRDGEGAQKAYAAAEKSPAADASLKNLKTKLDELLDDLKKIQNIDAEYSALTASAASFEKQGDEKTELSDKIGSYEFARSKFAQARNLKKGGDADARETALLKKIADAKAAEEKARKTAEETARKKAEQEAAERFNRKQFDDRLAAASGAIKTGDFATAQSNLDEAAKLFGTDPRLKDVSAELKKLQGDSDTRARAAIDLAAAKAPKHEFDAALLDLQGAAKLYPQRRDLSTAIDAISSLKRIDAAAQKALAASAGRLKDLDARAGSKGKNERARVTTAQGRLQSLTDTAIDLLAKSRFQDAAFTVRQLDADVPARQREITNALDQYEEAINVKEVTRPDPGNEDPFKKDPKKTAPPPKKTEPKTSKGTDQGDVDPFK